MEKGGNFPQGWALTEACHEGTVRSTFDYLLLQILCHQHPMWLLSKKHQNQDQEIWLSPCFKEKIRSISQSISVMTCCFTRVTALNITWKAMDGIHHCLTPGLITSSRKIMSLTKKLNRFSLIAPQIVHSPGFRKCPFKTEATHRCFNHYGLLLFVIRNLKWHIKKNVSC